MGRVPDPYKDKEEDGSDDDKVDGVDPDDKEDGVDPDNKDDEVEKPTEPEGGKTEGAA